MARPVPAFDLDKAIKLYQSGMTVTDAAKSVGTSRGSLKTQLGKRGLLRPQPHTLITDEMISTYRAGEKYKSIAARTGIAESVLKDRFSKLGILRGRIVFEPSQEIFDRYAAGETATALALEVGVSVNTLLGHLRAAGIARPISRREEELASMLSTRGVAFERQFSIGSYKVDFAFPEDSIAVEVDAEWGNRVRAAGRRLYAKRLEHILSKSWDLIEIRCRNGIAPGAADYVIAYLEKTRSNPAARGEYRMVGGDGKRLPSSRHEIHHWPVIAPPEAAA